MELYIVRHGQSEGNSGVAKDQCDPVLSELGITQARLLGDELSGIEFDRIFASPLRRTARTAYEVAAKQKKEIRIELLPELSELGTVPNHKWAFLEVCPNEYCPLALPMKIPTLLGGDGVHPEETRDDTFNRAKKVINYIKETARDDEKILISAHGVFNKYLFFAIIGNTYDCNVMLSQDNCCINHFILTKNSEGVYQVKIRSLNRNHHIPEEIRT